MDIWLHGCVRFCSFEIDINSYAWVQADIIYNVGLEYAKFTTCHVFLLECGTYCHLHKFAFLLSCKGGHKLAFENAFTCSTQVTTFASYHNTL